MRKTGLFFLFLFSLVFSMAQKQPLDHTVYDSWQSIGERMISNDGNWVVYTINVQEGDRELVIQSTSAPEKYKKIIPRGDSALITEDSRFVIFRIRPLFKETREARIKRKRTDEFPKDSLGIVELGKDSVWKMPRVKNFKTPEKGFGWVAYRVEKKADTVYRSDKKFVDSLTRVIDSLQTIIEARSGKTKNGDEGTAHTTAVSQGLSHMNLHDSDTIVIIKDTATTLLLRNLQTGQERSFKNVLEYSFSKNGNRLLIEQAMVLKDSQDRAMVLYYHVRKGTTDTLSRGGSEFKNFTIGDDGAQVAFLAEREAGGKNLQKFYKIWYYREGMDSAVLLADRNTTGMKLGMTISEYGKLRFSKSGKRLFFGTAPVQPPKDTTLVDIDLAKLDIWHYNDDYLQPTQLKRLSRDREQNFLAVYQFDQNKVVQLGSREIPLIISTNERDADQFVGISDYGKRIEAQWEGTTRKDIYAINVNEGTHKLVKKDLYGVIDSSYLSPTGKYILWYDSKERSYFLWNGKSTRNISRVIKMPLHDEEHDSPDEPKPYGIMGWHEDDSSVYVYDKYDVWSINLKSAGLPFSVTRGFGRKDKLSFRYIQTDTEKKFFTGRDELFFKSFDNITKQSGIRVFSIGGLYYGNIIAEDTFSVASFIVSKESNNLLSNVIYTKENYREPADIYCARLYEDPGNRMHDLSGRLDIRKEYEIKLSSINPQQKNYNWGSAGLFKWKAYNGKESEGIVYKPEDFDPKKNYPLICYFYETLSDGLNSYIPPAPTASRLNISFFVSRGYVVFAPDIHYTTGQPGKDAYDYVVSGTRALVRQGFIDSTRIGIQGQSWGGYQVAYLITATNLYKAAWAGAPVANMTSAYGGIRWETGVNRQFQYEKTQSRIGASLWEKPELYIESSPLFHLPKVKTPLVIMSNDADGAVPWYQGIELFTGMRRLGKKVWLLNYNGEAHNLEERRNRKDIQIREQQFFDWLLKGEHPPRWITEGVPAVNKGKDWGLEVEK